ncbi:MAG: hypothetical protein KKA41_10590 [Proteobacteria bacterium]|nr:hypothetical protein [Pseudomonadota bacterium]
MQGSQGIDFSQMFSDADEDGNGSIDETEFQTLAEKLSGSTETSSSESTRSALFSAIERTFLTLFKEVSGNFKI